MSKHSAFLLALAASPALANPVLAQSDCPTAAELDTSIVMQIEGGDTERFIRQEGGVIRSVYTSADGYQNRALSALGVYLIELVDLEDGEPDWSTRITYSFPLGADAMPVPQPGGLYNAEVTVFESGELRQEVQSHSFGALTQATYGACSYQMIPVEIRYGDDDDETVDLLHYLPQLGYAYFAGSSYNGEEGREEDIYSYYAIKADGAGPAKRDGTGKRRD